MKKILLILTCLFLNISFVNAKSNVVCVEKIKEGENILCSVTTDEEVSLSFDSSLALNSKDVNAISSGNKVTFTKDGNVTFKPNNYKNSNYSITVLYADGTSKTIQVALEKEETTSKKEEEKTSSSVKTTTTTTAVTTKTKSSDNFLTEITIDEEPIENFKKTTSKYFYTVPFDTEIIKVDAKTSDENAKLKINAPKKLEVGDNEITIAVTSEDNTTKYYKLVVTREKEKTSDTTIKNISVEGYDLDFDKNSKTFHLTIKDENQLNIKVELNDKDSSYEIFGNEDLKDESEIKIVVAASNDDTETYRIIINKKDEIVEAKTEEKSSFSVNYFWIVLIASIFGAGLVILIIYLINKKKNKNDDINNEDTKTNIPKETKNEKDFEKTIINLNIHSRMSKEEKELEKTILTDKSKFEKKVKKEIENSDEETKEIPKIKDEKIKKDKNKEEKVSEEDLEKTVLFKPIEKEHK